MKAIDVNPKIPNWTSKVVKEGVASRKTMIMIALGAVMSLFVNLPYSDVYASCRISHRVLRPKNKICREC